VVDLSKPSEIWFTLETLLAAAKARIENIIAEMKQEYPGLKEKLRKKAWERVGEEHSVSVSMYRSYTGRHGNKWEKNIL
jgi:dynein light intermediate chain 2